MKFSPGQTFSYGTIEYRVVAGNRCAGDMVIEFSLDNGQTWHRPHIAHSLILYCFKAQVENNNYPDGKGERKLLENLRLGLNKGWKVAATEIENEATWARLKREQPGLFEWL